MEFIGIPRHKLTAMPHEFGRLISGSAQQRVTAEEPASPSVTERVAEGGQFLVDGAIALSVLRVLNAPVTVSVATGIGDRFYCDSVPKFQENGTMPLFGSAIGIAPQIETLVQVAIVPVAANHLANGRILQVQPGSQGRSDAGRAGNSHAQPQ